MITIERLAKRMFDVTWGGTAFAWESESPVGRKHYLEQARAAVEELKTVDSKLFELPVERSFRSAWEDEAMAFWKAGLDAILNEKD